LILLMLRLREHRGFLELQAAWRDRRSRVINFNV